MKEEMKVEMEMERPVEITKEEMEVGTKGPVAMTNGETETKMEVESQQPKKGPVAVVKDETETEMKMKMKLKGPVVVTGASGYVGSWLVMKLLRDGYAVRATVRDPSNLSKVKPLLELPGAASHLTLWKADLGVEGSYDEIISGCTAVFHVATPMDFKSKDPENEVIKPAVEGLLSIMRSCKRAGTVQRIIYTSSAGTVNVEEHQKAEYDENSWSDLDFIRRVKMTGWMYFVSKSLAEKAAWDFARENGLDLITIIPTLVVGPFITSTMPPSMVTALSLITGNEAHYSIIKQAQLVHLDDLCDAHIFLLNHPKANGRYICSSHDATIYDIAKMLRDKYPQYYIPWKIRGIDDEIQPVRFSSKKLLELGFEYKYCMEEMFEEAIQTCREKKLIPLQTVETLHVNGKFHVTEDEHPVTKAIAKESEDQVPIATH